MRAALLLPMVLMGCSLLGGGKDRDRDEVSRLSGDVLCGVADIRGEEAGDIDPGGSACGIDNAVRVTSVAGVKLSQGALLNCRTAKVLNNWVATDMDAILGIKGGGVESLQVAAHYVCRTRNHRKGARLSEHSFGNAIDISAFNFKDGSSLSLIEHGYRGRDGRLLKRLHESACGPFGTVLGPGSDGYHEDHFHFDTAKHGNGPYCR